MKESYVSYEQAVKLKELGFEGNGLRNHIRQGYYLFPDGRNSPIKHEGDAILVEFERDGAERIPAPRLDQAQKWLREVKEIDIEISPILQDPIKNSRCYDPDLCYFDKDADGEDCVFFMAAGINFHSYESALSAGLDASLKLLTEKQ